MGCVAHPRGRPGSASSRDGLGDVLADVSARAHHEGHHDGLVGSRGQHLGQSRVDRRGVEFDEGHAYLDAWQERAHAAGQFPSGGLTLGQTGAVGGDHEGSVHRSIHW